MEGHALGEGDGGGAVAIVLEQGEALGFHLLEALLHLFHRSGQDSLPGAFVSHHCTAEEEVPGKVVTVGLRVNQVAHRAKLGNLIPPLDGIGGHLGGINHHHAFRGDYEARVAATKTSLSVDILGNLLHCLLHIFDYSWPLRARVAISSSYRFFSARYHLTCSASISIIGRW